MPTKNMPASSDARSLQRLPKISLHDHLDGGVRPSTIIDLAEQMNVELPATKSDALAAWFLERSNSGSLVEYLESFTVSTSVMQSAASLRRISREFVEDLAIDGVIYGEIRWAPEIHTRNGLSMTDAVAAVQAGINDGEKLARVSGYNISVRQLLTSLRHTSHSKEVAELAVNWRNRGVVGFDLAGPEAGNPASSHTQAFAYLASHLLPATIHAGEAAGLDSIRSAVVDGRALRLGHGVRIAEDIEEQGSIGERSLQALGDLARWVRDRKIALELSPTSNLQTGAVRRWGNQLADHPFDQLYRLGFNVTVNVDNRTMSGTTLTRELDLLMAAFEYSLDDVKNFQLNAANAAFLSLEERQSLCARITQGFEH